MKTGLTVRSFLVIGILAFGLGRAPLAHSDPSSESQSTYQSIAPTSAPTGTFTTETGAYCVAAAAEVQAKTPVLGSVTCNKAPSPSNEVQIVTTITSYTTKAELQALETASQTGAQAFLQTLAGFNHGTVTANGKTYPINAAFSNSSNGTDSYTALSAGAMPIKVGSSETVVGEGAAGSVLQLEVTSSESKGFLLQAGALELGPGQSGNVLLSEGVDAIHLGPPAQE